MSQIEYLKPNKIRITEEDERESQGVRIHHQVSLKGCLTKEGDSALLVSSKDIGLGVGM